MSGYNCHDFLGELLCFLRQEFEKQQQLKPEAALAGVGAMSQMMLSR